jgi:hypothetical protein
VRLDAIDNDRETKETIWVEVAGDEPKLTFDDLVQVHGLAFAPWVNREHKIVQNFRAEQVAPLDAWPPKRPDSARRRPHEHRSRPGPPGWPASGTLACGREHRQDCQQRQRHRWHPCRA